MKAKVEKSIVDPTLSTRTRAMCGGKPNSGKLIMSGPIEKLDNKHGQIFAHCKDAIYTLVFTGDVLKRSFLDAYNSSRPSKA